MIKQPESNVPNFIREWRDHRGLTQEALGTLIGHEKITLSRWERGKRRILVDQLKQVADALECTMYDLLYCNPETDLDLFTSWAKMPEDKRDIFRRLAKSLID